MTPEHEKTHTAWGEALERKTDSIDALLQAAQKMNTVLLRAYRDAGEEGFGASAYEQEGVLLDAAREYVEASNAVDVANQANRKAVGAPCTN